MDEKEWRMMTIACRSLVIKLGIPQSRAASKNDLQVFKLARLPAIWMQRNCGLTIYTRGNLPELRFLTKRPTDQSQQRNSRVNMCKWSNSEPKCDHPHSQHTKQHRGPRENSIYCLPCERFCAYSTRETYDVKEGPGPSPRPPKREAGGKDGDSWKELIRDFFGA